MAFVASLPTWNTEVTVYRVLRATQSAVELGTIVGQIYSWPKRSGSNTGDVPLGFLYPLDTEIKLHSVEDLDAFSAAPTYDILGFEWEGWPYPGLAYFGVQDVFPRYLNFPNAHNVAELFTCELRSLNDWFWNPADGGTVVVADAGVDECDSCADIDGTHPLYYVSENHWLTQWFPLNCYIVGGYAYYELFYNDVSDIITLHLRAVPPGTTIATWTLEVEDWDYSPQELEWESGNCLCLWPATVAISVPTQCEGSANVPEPPEGDLTLDFDTEDGTCDCNELSGTHPMEQVVENNWYGEVFPWACVEPDTGVRFQAVMVGDVMQVYLVSEPTITTLATWVVDITTQPVNGPYELTLDFGTDVCDWPTTITVTETP